jgi:hypothetical protein
MTNQERVAERRKHWSEPIPKDADRDKWNREHFRYFDFDVLLTNPPLLAT